MTWSHTMLLPWSPDYSAHLHSLGTAVPLPQPEAHWCLRQPAKNSRFQLAKCHAGCSQPVRPSGYRKPDRLKASLCQNAPQLIRPLLHLSWDQLASPVSPCIVLAQLLRFWHTIVGPGTHDAVPIDGPFPGAGIPLLMEPLDMVMPWHVEGWPVHVRKSVEQPARPSFRLADILLGPDTRSALLAGNITN